MSYDMVSAHKVFDKLPDRNVVSSTALSFIGYSLNVFVAMRREGVRENQFTSGCALVCHV
ncbi:hypothetical protein KY290_020248 [Solanum tuberosum]|uniref:Uncharacterized protein n=1 Tax=Solanum tuberosum TaxID=4113 RepID=A0ABQ7UY66_SOLTU|nr:hypothetical protein KY289_019403 [Solanum tuberosum]KAH0756755.1 hypothetical protein KY290_020248 [Solanum tuberosum]